MRPTRRNSTERRTSTRADAQLSMRLGTGPGPEFVTETQNISSSGVYCYSPHYLAPLSKVGLTLVLPPLAGARRGDQLVKCEAVVVRCQQAGKLRANPLYELACSFLGLDEAHRRLLADYVTYRNLQALAGEARRATTGAAARRPARTAGKKAAGAGRKAVARTSARAATGRALRKSAAKRTSASRPAAKARKKK